MSGKDINKLWIAFVILLAAIGTGAAVPTVVIKQTGNPVVNITTHDILKVEYGNFTTGDNLFYSITITNNSGKIVYSDANQLNNPPIEMIPIDWTPLEDGNYTLVANGIGLASSKFIAVYDSKQINITPELSTIVLTLAGLIGVLGIARMKRKDQ